MHPLVVAKTHPPLALLHLRLLSCDFSCLGFGAGVEGSTFTHEFDADGIVSFLHGLPHFDLTLHKADNRFDPKSWSYDQVRTPSSLFLLLLLSFSAVWP